jgi:hypothetical protein
MFDVTATTSPRVIYVNGFDPVSGRAILVNSLPARRFSLFLRLPTLSHPLLIYRSAELDGRFGIVAAHPS